MARRALQSYANVTPSLKRHAKPSALQLNACALGQSLQLRSLASCTWGAVGPFAWCAGNILELSSALRRGGKRRSLVRLLARK